MRQAIETKFLPWTNHRPSRVKAFCQAGSVTMSWDHNLNVDNNHIAAAKALAQRLGWDGIWYGGSSPSGKGSVFINSWSAGDTFTVVNNLRSTVAA